MPFFSQTKYKGMMSLRRATELPVGYCADSLNGDLGSSSVAAPEKGYSLFGRQANATDKIVRKYTYTKGDGTEIMLHVRDNATNYILEYLNKGDTRNSQNGEWTILETGLTRNYTLADGTTPKARFDFASFNDTGTNQLVYGNGVEAMRVWNGAIGSILSVTATTVVLTGTATLVQLGFGATTSIIINGNTYTVSGISGQTFTVGSSPVGEAVGSGVAQVVNTSTLSAADKGSILLTAFGRLWLAGITATPNQVTFSAVSDITTYTDSGVPNNGGFEDFPQMNGAITGLSYIDDWIIVGSKKHISAFKFEFPTATTRIIIRKDIADEGFASHKAIRKIGDWIFYITPNGGIKKITQVANQNVFTVEDLTEPIRPTIEKFVWSDAVLEYLPKKRVLIAAGMSSSSVSDNDKMIALYFTVESDESGNTFKSFNLGIMDWFVGDACIFEGNLHFGSSVISEGFLAFDGYSKNGAPYIWRRVERVEFFGDPWLKKWSKTLAVRGAIGPGTTIYFNLKYNINGAVTSQDMQLKDSDSDFVIQQPLNTLGGFALGTEPLGGTITEISNLYPFLVKFPLPNVYAEDLQLTFKTDGSGQICQIDTHGFDVEDSEEMTTANELKSLGLS